MHVCSLYMFTTISIGIDNPPNQQVTKVGLLCHLHMQYQNDEQVTEQTKELAADLFYVYRPVLNSFYYFQKGRIKFWPGPNII